jgi:hypothetical protein
MTIPLRAAGKNAAAPLNGLSPTRSNRFLGFELMKIITSARSFPGRHRMRPGVGTMLTLPRRRDRCCSAIFCGAEHIAGGKSSQKPITAVDNAMTAT